jgi:hypothetical protein
VQSPVLKFTRDFPRNLAPGFTHYLSERLEMSSQRREITEGQNNERKINKMKNQNIVFIAIAFALAFALAPVTQATPCPRGAVVSNSRLSPSIAPEISSGGRPVPSCWRLDKRQPQRQHRQQAHSCSVECT